MGRLNLNPVGSVGRIDAMSSARGATPLPDALILTIKQVPGRCAPGYYQITINQPDSPWDSPFGGAGLISEADWYKWLDSYRESSWITSGSPIPDPNHSESRIDRMADHHPWMDHHPRLDISCRSSFLAVDD